jgi:4'-phosphopantetheinyl transferase
MPHPACRLTITPSHIDLWLAFYDDIAEAGLLPGLRTLLSDDERCREQRFHFADDRQRHLVTRAMVRTVLSRYAAVAPADWVFSANAYGRPQIANAHGDAAGLCFNLSHTRGLIVLGVTRHGALGVDVEHLHARQVSMGIAGRFFSPGEAAELALTPPAQRQERFFEYWTFKESYIKARGLGLSIPLDRFSFHYPHERAVRLSVDPSLGDEAGRWAFWQFRLTHEHLLAVCAERQGPQAPVLALRRFMPMGADQPFAAPLLKCSEPQPPGRARAPALPVQAAGAPA